MVICMAAQIQPEQQERSAQWLAWTADQRNIFIVGLVSGYQMGSLKACNSVDDLFEIGQPHHPGDKQHPTNIPSGRCLAAIDTYSKCVLKESSYPSVDCSAYTGTITEFYTKHPEYRGIPFTYLFEFLSDSKHKTADELYQMALKGEMQTTF